MKNLPRPSSVETLSNVYELDPLQDPRWRAFVDRDARASVFHHPAWLETLHRTYGYKPVVLTTAAPGEELRNGVPLCSIESWITGRRMVSLPFSDHCEPLVDAYEFQEILRVLQDKLRTANLRYVELRPLSSLAETSAGRQFAQFVFHTIDLRRTKDDLFESLHKDSIRRKVHRGTREGLVCERGTSTALLRSFYQLFVMTRRRHSLPPTPYRWFHNLVECLGNNAEIYVAFQNHSPVASLFMLKHGKKMVYKYGGSNHNVSNLGGTPFLFWKVIENAKSEGLEQLDLGRSDLDNEGLITFKNRLGGRVSPLHYWRLSAKSLPKTSPGWMGRFAKHALAHSPDALRIQVGNIFYRHLG